MVCQVGPCRRDDAGSRNEKGHGPEGFRGRCAAEVICSEQSRFGTRCESAGGHTGAADDGGAPQTGGASDARVGEHPGITFTNDGPRQVDRVDLNSYHLLLTHLTVINDWTQIATSRQVTLLQS